VQRELRRLAAVGIISRRERGRQVDYQANRQSPVFAELHSLMVKTTGVVDVLRAALAGLDGRGMVAFLYGSMVKGRAGPASDVDVLVVGEATFGEVVAALSPAQEKLGREVNPTVYPPTEFRRKLAAKHHFLTSVVKEPKVFLVGGEVELVRLAEKASVLGVNRPGRKYDDPN
jgi:predicted nucleotidyltransferase